MKGLLVDTLVAGASMWGLPGVQAPYLGLPFTQHRSGGSKLQTRRLRGKLMSCSRRWTWALVQGQLDHIAAGPLWPTVLLSGQA